MLEPSRIAVASPISARSRCTPAGGQTAASPRSVKYAPNNAPKNIVSDAMNSTMPSTSGAGRVPPGRAAVCAIISAVLSVRARPCPPAQRRGKSRPRATLGVGGGHLEARPWHRFYADDVPHDIALPDAPLHAFLRASAARHPGRAAVILSGPGFHSALSYRALDRATDRFAGGLRALGLR